MEQIYNDAKNPGGLGGVNRLAKAALVTKKEARKFLQERDEYTVNKERRKKLTSGNTRLTSILKNEATKF